MLVSACMNVHVHASDCISGCVSVCAFVSVSRYAAAGVSGSVTVGVSVRDCVSVVMSLSAGVSENMSVSRKCFDSYPRDVGTVKITWVTISRAALEGLVVYVSLRLRSD